MSEAFFYWTLTDWQNEKSEGKKQYLTELLCGLDEEKWEGADKFHAHRTAAWIFKNSSFGELQSCFSTEADYYGHYKNSFFAWLKICLIENPENEHYFLTTLITGKKGEDNVSLDREQSIIYMIKKNGDLDRFFFTNNTLDEVGRKNLRYLITWFIRRYDLKTAGWLLKQLKKHRPRARPETVPPTEETGSAPWDWGGACQYLVPMLLAAALLLPFLFHDAYRFILPLIYVSLPAGVLWLLTSPQANLAIGLLVPRLAGCIIVGYLPLVVGIETWQAIGYLAKTPYSWQLYVLIVIAGLAAFGYLIVEMQHINLAKCEVIRRSLKVYTLGLSWSLGIGLVMLDLLGLAYQKMDGNNFLCDTQLTWLPGLLGKIPWEILLGYVPLALLIGIFLQIIWEEKPITEPL